MQDELIVAIAILVIALLVFALWQRRQRSSTSRAVVIRPPARIVIRPPARIVIRPPARIVATEPAASPRPVARAEDRAREAALGALGALDLPPGRERALQLATIARRYFTDAYGIAAGSATTAELHEMLRRHDRSTEASRGLVDAIDAARSGSPSAIRELEVQLRAILAD